MNIIQAIEDKKLFKRSFRKLKTWQSWLTLLRCFFGLSLSEQDLTLYRECTGRKGAPGGEFKELWAIVGRRGGKSFIASVISVYLALFHKYQEFLSPGERGIIQVIASDRAQAQVILRYIKGIFSSNPVFAQYIESETRETLSLTNNISIEVMSCSFRSIRGRTVVAAVFDEISFWRSDLNSANPDREILNAVRPGMATIPGAKLIVISSPYARSGVLYEHFRDYHGKEDNEILVWQAPTRVMNPTIKQRLIDRETKRDPSAAGAEWHAQFRSDIESYVSREALEACVVPNRYELPFISGNFYKGFVDSSGGSRDSFTLAIAHMENEVRVLDLIREVTPPFNPEAVVKDFCETLSAYNLTSVTGDRYAGAWVSSAFEKIGVNYQVSDKPKSDIYKEFLPMINSGRVELLDIKKLLSQILGLERRTARSGRDSIDHGPNGFDDLANSAAGALVSLDEICDEEIAGVGYLQSIEADWNFLD